MMKPLTGTKVAVLVANGFEEAGFLQAQKKLLEMGATIRIISTSSGLVNGWDGQAWGHNYAVDAPLNIALGADYEALVVPGGQRSIDKLKLTAHTRRFIGSFMAAGKPVAIMDDAVMLMALVEQVMDMKVCGPEHCRDICEQEDGKWMEDVTVYQDRRLLTGVTNGENAETYYAAMQEMFTPEEAVMNKAA